MELLSELFPPGRIAIGRIAEGTGPAMNRLRQLLRGTNHVIAPMDLGRTIASGIPEALRIGVVEILRIAIRSTGRLQRFVPATGVGIMPAATLNSVLRPRIEIILGGDIAAFLQIEAHIETRVPECGLARLNGTISVSFRGPLDLRGELMLEGDAVASSAWITAAAPRQLVI